MTPDWLTPLQEALSGIPTHPRVTRAFPRTAATLPCLVLLESGRADIAFADDAPVLQVRVLDLRAYARSPLARAHLAAEAAACLHSLGFHCALQYEQDDESLPCVFLRFRKFFPIYDEDDE
jgi:hypothetical protein